MDYFGDSINELIEALRRLPGVGAKSAQRLAFHIVGMSGEDVERLAGSIVRAKESARFCSVCCTFTDQEVCPICRSAESGHRDKRQIMVVENSRDLAAYERTGRYEGVYHVLNGTISPLLGVGPNDIKVRELIMRLQEAGESAVDEVILATGASVEGESTAMYIAKLIRAMELPVRITRIASGIPVGGDIENIDEVTLERALKARTEI